METGGLCWQTCIKLYSLVTGGAVFPCGPNMGFCWKSMGSVTYWFFQKVLQYELLIRLGAGTLHQGKMPATQTTV